MRIIAMLVTTVLVSLQLLAGGTLMASAGENKQTELKQACLSATMTAITMEINHYLKWIDMRKQQGNSQDIHELEESLASLQAELEKYRNMDVDEYVLPEKVVATAWVNDKPGENSLLYIDMMSKSGPFYHLAGIVGGDYSVLQPSTRYDMTFYKVYPRSYWNMESDYVYIASADQALSTITKQHNLQGGPSVDPALRDSDVGMELAEGFLGWSWGSRPDDLDGVKYFTDLAPGLAVYSADLDISSITGDVRAYANPRLVFSKDCGLVFAHIDFEYQDYFPIEKRLTQLLGEPNPIIYELWAARGDFSERSEWQTGNTRVVLTAKGTAASLEISKRGYDLQTGSSFEQMLSAALLKQAQEYDQQNLIIEASSVYQTLLNNTGYYSFFTNIAEEQLAKYSRREEAVDYLSADRDMQFYRLKNIFTDSIEQQWIRIDLGAGAQAELQIQRPADIADTDRMANISAVLCRVRIDYAAGKFAVVEQIWLDEENQIIGGRPAWAPQDNGWPVPYIRQACETFLTAWFSFTGESYGV